MTPYRALLELAHRERELADEGRFEELAALGAEWEALTAVLPPPGPEERVLLEEIEVTVWSTVAAIRLQAEDTRQLLALVQRGRRAIDAYGGAFKPVVVDSAG